jgi:transcriptional regulator with XRE-family HTH domain
VTSNMAPIPKRELLEYQADVKSSIFRQIRERFARLKQEGFTQKDLATKIGMNEGQLSRRLRGDYDLRLETLSDLARGLDCSIDVRLAPILRVSSLTTDQRVFATVDQCTAFWEPTRWEKYHETNNEVLKRHNIWSSSVGRYDQSFAFKESSLSTKNRRKCHNKLRFGNRTLYRSRMAAQSPKKSPESAKFLAPFKMVGVPR